MNFIICVLIVNQNRFPYEYIQYVPIIGLSIRFRFVPCIVCTLRYVSSMIWYVLAAIKYGWLKTSALFFWHSSGQPARRRLPARAGIFIFIPFASHESRKPQSLLLC